MTVTPENDALVLMLDLLIAISKYMTLPTGRPLLPGVVLDHRGRIQNSFQ